MERQRELFDIDQRTWVDRLWQSIPTGVRQEAIAILAQMGKMALGEARKRAATPKEVRDE